MTRSIFMSKVDKGCKGYSQFDHIASVIITMLSHASPILYVGTI